MHSLLLVRVAGFFVLRKEFGLTGGNGRGRT
nr:MAG TPA: hypothetical protein [Caudoviricetes sp.]